MQAPLLTIMMPSYNYGHFLRQAIESILAQDFTDYEFLIIDDGSSDKSPEIIREYLHDKRIEARLYTKNEGMLQRVNEGTHWARGKYIHYLAADDYRYPFFLSKCMNTLIDHPRLGMCYTQYDRGNEEKLYLEKCGFETGDKTLFFEPKNMHGLFSDPAFKIFSVSAIVKTDLVKKYGYFDPLLYYFADWYLFNEIAFNHSLAMIPEPLSRFRIHDSNFSNVYRHQKKIKLAAYNRIFEKLKDNPTYKEQIRKSALLNFLFHDLFWKLLFNPRYLTYWPYINRKYPIKQRIKSSLKKKLFGKTAL